MKVLGNDILIGEIRCIHQRQRAVQWRSSTSASMGGGKLRSKGKAGFRKDEEAMSQYPSSTTDEEESQSLWQSSGTIGGERGCRLEDEGTVVVAAVVWGLGPLKDSTVELKLLEVGLWGGISGVSWYNRFWWWSINMAGSFLKLVLGFWKLLNWG